MNTPVLTRREPFCKGRPAQAFGYWAARRRWWRAEKRRCGTNWIRIRETMRAVLGEQSSTFLEACARADAAAGPRQDPAPIPSVKQHGVPSARALQRLYEQAIQRRRDQHGAARSTLATGAFLACTDSARFEIWLMPHAPTERAAVIAHLRQQRDRS